MLVAMNEKNVLNVFKYTEQQYKLGCEWKQLNKLLVRTLFIREQMQIRFSNNENIT